MAGSPNPVLVTAAVIEKEGRVLIARRLTASHGAGGWEFPGGKIEPGETPEECLVREIREELEIHIHILGSFLDYVHEYPEKSIRLISFRAHITAGIPVPSDHEELAWATPEELTGFDFLPADLPIVEAIRNSDLFTRP